MNNPFNEKFVMPVDDPCTVFGCDDGGLWHEEICLAIARIKELEDGIRAIADDDNNSDAMEADLRALLNGGASSG